MFAFSRNEEIARLHPRGTHTRSMVTPASGALEFARRQGDAWLYIDPAGPTCAVSAAEIDFALRNPRNEALKHALVALSAGRIDRRAVLEVLRQNGPLLLSADDRTQPGQIALRSTTLPDGSPALLAFTSAPEAVSHRPEDAVVALTVSAVLDKVRTGNYGGLVIDPSGPYLALSRNEFDGFVDL